MKKIFLIIIIFFQSCLYDAYETSRNNPSDPFSDLDPTIKALLLWPSYSTCNNLGSSTGGGDGTDGGNDNTETVVTKPDIEVVSLTLGEGTSFQGGSYYLLGNTYTVTAKIKNNGTAISQSFIVKATIGNNINETTCMLYYNDYFSSSTSIDIGSSSVSSLTSGEEKEISISITIPSSYSNVGLSNYIGIAADSGSTVSESDEYNNCGGFNSNTNTYSTGEALKQITISQYLPDIAMVSFNVTSGGTYTRGQSYTINASIKNNGPKNISQVFYVKATLGNNINNTTCKLYYYDFFSSSTSIDIGSSSVISLNSDETKNVSISITIPSSYSYTGSSNYIGLALDSTSVIGELSKNLSDGTNYNGESNNCGGFDPNSNTYSTGDFLKQVNIN